MCLKKLKIEIPYDLAISLLGIYPNKIKTLIQKDIWKKKIYAPHVHSSIIYNNGDREAT